jgi:hypothetical protein
MKIRYGFVSNSSSSSFICGITNQTYGGYGSDPSDFDLLECECGHTFLWYKYQFDLETVPLEEIKRNILLVYRDNAQLVSEILFSNFDKYEKLVLPPDSMDSNKLDKFSRLQIINLYFILDSWIDWQSNWYILTSLKNVDMSIFSSPYISIPKSWCPICQLEYISNDNFYNYLKANGFDVEKIKTEIRDKFKTSTELENFISKKLNTRRNKK